MRENYFFGDYNGDYKNFKNFYLPQIFTEQLKKTEAKIFQRHQQKFFYFIFECLRKFLSQSLIKS